MSVRFNKFLEQSLDLEGAVEYFYEEDITTEELDMVIEEVGLDDFVNYLEEERSARKMNVRSKGTIKKTIAADAAKEAKRKEKKTGEYKEKPKKKAKIGTPSYTTKVTGATKKVKAKTAAKKSAPKAKAKPAPKKKASKEGIRSRLKRAYKKGVARHKKAVNKNEFTKGVVSGVKAVGKAAKDVHSITQVNKKKTVNMQSYEPEGELVEGDVHSGQGEKIQKRTKAWMDKKGESGAPGLDAMKARTAEHKAKRGVKEEVVDESIGDQVRKGLKRHKDAVEKKKIKNRKAVPYAALAAGYEPEEEMVEHHKKPGEDHPIEEELSRRSKPSAKAKMAKLDAVLKAREDAAVAKKKETAGVKEEKKPQKAMDAGARAKRKLARKEYAAKVSGSEDNVPDDIREVAGAIAGSVAKGAILKAGAKTAAKGAIRKAAVNYAAQKGGEAVQKKVDQKLSEEADQRLKVLEKIKKDRRERAVDPMTTEKMLNKKKNESDPTGAMKPIVAEFVDHLWEATKRCSKCGKVYTGKHHCAKC